MNPDELPSPEDQTALDLLASGAEALGAREVGPCPVPDILVGVAEGRLAAPARDAVERHLSLCGPCRTIVATLARVVPAPADAAGEDAAAEPPLPVDSAFPRRFGPYVLLRRLGRGGMGDVFEAEVPGRGRREALKQVRAGLEHDPRIAERFAREIHAMAGARSPHVMPLYDSGCIDDVLYFTMPLLPGPSVGRLVGEIRATGEAPPGSRALAVLDAHGVPDLETAGGSPESRYVRRTARLFVGVARALQALHDAGVLHRDVKPGNLLLDERRALVLGDLGLARGAAAGMTGTRETLGTPAYLAPEQLSFDGERATGPQTDVYGLGATLYEVWTLQRPFEGATLAATLAALARGTLTPPAHANPALPADAATLLERAMAHRSDRRYPTALALALDLEALAEGRPVAARPRGWPERAADGLRARWKPALAAAAALLALGIAYLTWPTHLSVRAVRGAGVLLDGTMAGTCPLEARRVEPGTHRIDVRHPLFEPFEVHVGVERRENHVVHVAMRPRDPADTETVRLLTEASGLARHEVEVRSQRDGEGLPSPVVLSPRGLLLDPPERITLWADAPLGADTLRLERDGASKDEATLAPWPLEGRVGRVPFELPRAARDHLLPGSAWTLRLRGATGGTRVLATFRLASLDRRQEIRRDLEGLARGRAPSDPVVSLLQAEFCLAQGLWIDAVDHAADFADRAGPDRREPARLALAALDGAGLRDSAPWTEWVTRYLRAQR